MALYRSHLTLRARPLTDDDYQSLGGSITLTRANESPTTYSFQVGDFQCTRWVGDQKDDWVMTNTDFSLSGLTPVSPPDGAGFVQYNPPPWVDVTSLDNGFYHLSDGSVIDNLTFQDSHVLIQ